MNCFFVSPFNPPKRWWKEGKRSGEEHFVAVIFACRLFPSPSPWKQRALKLIFWDLKLRTFKRRPKNMTSVKKGRFWWILVTYIWSNNSPSGTPFVERWKMPLEVSILSPWNTRKKPGPKTAVQVTGHGPPGADQSVADGVEKRFQLEKCHPEPCHPRG